MKALMTVLLCIAIAVAPGCAWAGGVFEAVTSIPKADQEAVMADAMTRVPDELAKLPLDDWPPSAGEMAEASANAMAAAADHYWTTHEPPPPNFWQQALSIGMQIATGAGGVSLLGGVISGRSKGMLSALLGALNPSNPHLTFSDAPKAIWAGLGPGHSGALMTKVAASKEATSKANKAAARAT